MKRLSVVLSVALSLASQSGFAGMPKPASGGLSVKITSFTSINLNDHTGEVCGQVTVDTSVIPKVTDYIAVTVTSDPQYNPGPYTVLASPTGAFCTVILTQSGTAEAEAWLPGTQMKATSGVMNLGSVRK